MLTPWKETYDQPRQHIKKQRHYFANKSLSSQAYHFSSSHVWMWELDYIESWALKNWCFWTVVLEKTLESPLDCKEIQPVHPKGDQSWVFTGRTDAEAETPLLWPPHAELTHWKRPWCLERLRAGAEGENRGWDGWMASLTQWTWVWVDSGSWWWTGRPGMLWFMRLQRVGHDWATELNRTELNEDGVNESTVKGHCAHQLLSLCTPHGSALGLADAVTMWMVWHCLVTCERSHASDGIINLSCWFILDFCWPWQLHVGVSS